MNLNDFDANLYRLYAVGLLSYEQALDQAQSLVQLRRALLAFDQNAQPPRTSTSPPASSQPGSAAD